MEVTRVAIRMLETEAPFAEIDFASDARIHHPLQRAVDGGSADALIFAPDQIDEIIGAQVSLLPEEHIHDLVTLAGTFRSRGAQPIDIRNGCGHSPLGPRARRDVA